MDDNKLSIVLPVFNEADVIEEVVVSINLYVSRLVVDVEIIAVDDGSTDGTLEVLNRLGQSMPTLKVISHQKNVGYGGALVSGIKAAGKTWILLMDSDGQMQIDSLQEAWSYRNEYDLLLGYRKQRADSFYRRILGKTGNTVSNMLLGHRLRDINCGFKLFKRDLIQPLKLSSTGNIINFEILYLLFKNHLSLRFFQFPVTHYSRKVGKSTGGNPKVIYKIIVEGIKVLLKIK